MERTVAVSQVAQDIGAWRAVEHRVEFGENALTGGLVRRVYGDDLPAGAAWRIFRIAHEHGHPAGQEFERNIPGYAVLPYLRHYFAGIIETGGYVDLPSLRGDRRAWRDVDQPVTEALAPPSGGQRLTGYGKILRRRVIAVRKIIKVRTG